MSLENDSQTTLRDAITANLDAADAGTLDSPQADMSAAAPAAAPAPEVSAPAASPAPVADGRVRDQHGRFAKTAAEEVAAAAAAQAAPQPTTAPVATQAPVAATPPERLTTWKKEFLPLHDKLATGQQLTPEEAKRLADYNVQREKEYATGISTYKAEATQAKGLQEAMNEFMPMLQQHRIDPPQWLRSLGRAQQTLSLGSPEQKLAMFAQLAHMYGIPLQAIAPHQQGHLDPMVPALMAEINNLKQGVNTVTGRLEQQDQLAIQKELARFEDTEKFPHFQAVRADMARLLESGFAQTPDEAYTKAVRLNEEAWSAEQQRQVALTSVQAATSKAAAVVKAKGAALSLRSSSPVSTTQAPSPNDRRAALAAGLDASTGRV